MRKNVLLLHSVLFTLNHCQADRLALQCESFAWHIIFFEYNYDTINFDLNRHPQCCRVRRLKSPTIRRATNCTVSQSLAHSSCAWFCRAHRWWKIYIGNTISRSNNKYLQFINLHKIVKFALATSGAHPCTQWQIMCCACIASAHFVVPFACQPTFIFGGAGIAHTHIHRDTIHAIVQNNKILFLRSIAHPKSRFWSKFFHRNNHFYIASE